MKTTSGKNRDSRWQRTLLATAVSLAALASPSAQAFQFKLNDEITGSFDTTLSYGSIWRVTGQDAVNIATASGGTKPNVNFDNGDLNHKRGEQVSSLFKMTNELDINYRNYGAFVRVLSFYDAAVQGKEYNPNRANQGVIRNRLGHDYEILDAYVRGTFKIGDRRLNVRAGQQVVSWGESTFIPNGINVINPVDVVKLRAPGAELKEAFLPVDMLWASQEITDNLSIEAFNQFGFKKTRLEPNGSYFSTNDHASPGGSYIAVAGGDNPPAGAASITRIDDRNPRHRGQFGVALRWLVPALNNTEFGLYHITYHSRTPVVSGSTGTTIGAAAEARYFTDYPESIKLYGLSFNTPGPLGIALQGEYSYRPNMPLQIAATDLLNAVVTQNTVGSCAPPGRCAIGMGALAPNTTYAGYLRVPFHQFQMTGTKSFGPRLKADQVLGVMEAGYTYMSLPDTINGNRVVFNGPGLDRVAATQATGQATNDSFGYRMVLRADYLNALGPINVSPRVAYSHDVHGTSPTFVQGVKAATLGVTFAYQNRWQADVAYTNFFGGRTFSATGPNTTSSSNPLSDRDFMAASISYSF